MWRAWGIALLFLSPQDLGPRLTAPEHELAFRPPASWIRHVGSGPTLVKFTQPGELKVPAEFMVTHLTSSNPTPLESFKRQARDNITEKFAEAKILEEKDLSIAGKPSFRIVYALKDLVFLKNVVHKTNLEYYMLDAAYPPDQAGTVRPLIESSIATFEIVPEPLSSEEKAAEARTAGVLQGAKIDPGLLGERWYTMYLGSKRVGHLRARMSEVAGAYAIEGDLAADFGDGNTDTTLIRGSFSPDARLQKIETEQTKVNPKQHWVFRATAAIQDGTAKISRDMNGVKEERSFTVESGVLLSDVAEFLRPALVGSGRGTYLLKSLSPYVEQWNVDMIDVGGPEMLDIDGRTRECILVQASMGRRRTVTYYYSPERLMLRLGGPAELFSIRAATKEEALKK